ncbi:hypothetical protein B0J11DRAFT_482550 [Dendryphion nanum]|uniref:UBC core domain-containing protein n=1 Tax=Dendryphion nanum TaxID=256645 RepID=A0A9P9E591_9PLEO|nr:hypothetical protein B0J11DRAFT_482550 [Dendryphion nanum]
MTDAGVHFCVEDTVGLPGDKIQVGIVDRSFGDVDSHEPRPQRDYGETIERHQDVPEPQFNKFLRTGIPPRGTVLVSWQSPIRTELIPEACLELLDRALYVGDVVKRNTQSSMSGTVIGTKPICTLFPAAPFNLGPVNQTIMEEFSIRDVPAEELFNVHEFVEGALVLYEDWVGRVEHVYDDVAIKLSNNSVVVVENAEEELDPDDPAIERLSVGDTVSTKKHNLRRGRWKYGAYDANVRPRGIVVETRTVSITVHWLARRFGASAHTHEPPSDLTTDHLQSPAFRIYDASGNAASTLPLSSNGVDRIYHVADVTVADRVRFKDLTAAAVKYDGAHSSQDGRPQGRLTRVPRTETLGYDLNAFIVLNTVTQVTVQWQDLTVTQHPSSLLVPDPNVEDDDELWPGEIVCTKEQRGNGGDIAWTSEPEKVGVVQSVNSQDRLTTVRWFESPNIRFLGDDLIPPSETGTLSNVTEDVSLYDIRSTASLTRRRGDFVLIHPDSVGPTAHAASEPTWFGEVVDLGLDGLLTVRLGAAKPVIDIRLPIEKMTLVYSSDMPDDALGLVHPLDGESVDDSDLSGSDFESFNDMWIEYEGIDGEPIDDIDDADWSTEEEDSDSDLDPDSDSDSDSRPDSHSMPDFEPSSGAQTSKTTPELPSDSEHKVSPNTGRATDHTQAHPPDLTTSAHEPLTSTPEAPQTTLETNSDVPISFIVLETPPPTDHHYLDTSIVTTPTWLKRIAKEHKILSSSLPPGIFVRAWESRLDLLRVLVIGPSDTPYEYAPFVIDFHLGASYPSQAPEAFFHSWTNGDGPVNPNLYEDGKICLSLLGTWHADERNESWSSSKSTLLQVLVSIMGLVLVKEPYYNEAGYEVHREAPETKLNSALYTERALFRARAFIVHALTNRITPFDEELQYLYINKKEGCPRLLDESISTARDILRRSEEPDNGQRDGLRYISRGAAVMLKRQVEKMENLRTTMN